MPVVRDYTAVLSGTTINGTIAKGAFISYSFPTSVPNYLTGSYTAAGLSTFRAFSEDEKTNARAAVAAYAAISGLNFFEVAPGDGDIKFASWNLASLGSGGAAGFAYYPDDGYGGSGVTSDIFIGLNGNISYANSSSYGHQHILIHELGHALGLKHPFEGDAVLATDLDNYSNTVMSYTAGGYSGDVLGAFDIAAIQSMYGDASNKGSQVPSWSWNAATLTLSQTGSAAGEAIYGIGGNDTIRAGDGNDTIYGRGGIDKLYGESGNDTLNDSVTGGAGVVLDGGAGDDVIVLRLAGSATGLIVDGGTGTDRATITFSDTVGRSFAMSGLGLVNVEQLTLDLAASVADDAIIIDGAVTSANVSTGGGNDVIRAGVAGGTLHGGAGVDQLVAGTGMNFLYGGSGADRFAFETVDSSRAGAIDQIEDFASGDLIDISAFQPTGLSFTPSGAYTFVSAASPTGNFQLFVRGNVSAADFVTNAVTGDVLANTLTGTAGRDIIRGINGGDTLTGGAGLDFFVGTVDDFRNDTITDLQVGEQIVFTDATLAGFTFSRPSASALRVGSTMLTLNNAPNGSLTVSAGLYGGVALTLQGPRVPGDLNNDGRADLVWRNVNGVFGDWLASGAGFSVNSASIVGVPSEWKIVGRGDFNGDGIGDLLWRNEDGRVSDWLGNAAGVLMPNNASVVGVGTEWKVAGTGDFNGDGFGDILWRHDGGAFADWLGNAQGVFTPNGASLVSVTNDWKIAGTGDFNGDGRSDILWRNDNGTIADWLGGTIGNFTANNASLAAGGTLTVAGTGDFDGDGRSDIAMRNASGRTFVWSGLPNGAFLAPIKGGTLLGAGTTVADTGDYSGEGLTDLLVRASDGTATTWLGRAATMAVNPALQATFAGWRMAGSADFNGDGIADLVWRNASDGSFGDWLGNAQGTFSVNQPSIGNVSTDWDIAGTGDFNGDGRADILWRNNDGRFSNWLASASGTFVPNNASVASVSTDWGIVGTGDFNGDGRSDVLWRNNDGRVVDWLSNANGVLVPNNSWGAAVPWSWAVRGTGDFNGDGRSDLLWQNGDGTTGSWFGNADGSFAVNPVTVSLGSEAFAGLAGDYNGDGRTDFMSRTGSVFTAWLSTTDNSFAASARLTASVSLVNGITAGDFNGDGLADLMANDLRGTLTEVLTRGSDFIPSGGPAYGVGNDWRVVR